MTDNTNSVLDWKEFPKHKPPHDTNVLVFTKNQSIVLCRFLHIAWVEEIPMNNAWYGRYRMVDNSTIEPVFVPLHELQNDHWKTFQTDVTHWCLSPEMPK